MKWELTYLRNPSVVKTPLLLEASSPIRSMGFISKAARIEAMQIHRKESPKKRPGQIL